MKATLPGYRAAPSSTSREERERQGAVRCQMCSQRDLFSCLGLPRPTFAADGGCGNADSIVKSKKYTQGEAFNGTVES